MKVILSDTESSGLACPTQTNQPPSPPRMQKKPSGIVWLVLGSPALDITKLNKLMCSLGSCLEALGNSLRPASELTEVVQFLISVTWACSKLPEATHLPFFGGPPAPAI